MKKGSFDDMVAVLKKAKFLGEFDREAYHERNEDDSPDGKLIVIMAKDGDIHISIAPSSERKIGNPSCRFCTRAGGGRSRRVRHALMFLAMAIEADNKENPIS